MSIHPERRGTVRLLHALAQYRTAWQQQSDTLFPALNDAVNLALQYQYARERATDTALHQLAVPHDEAQHASSVERGSEEQPKDWVMERDHFKQAFTTALEQISKTLLSFEKDIVAMEASLADLSVGKRTLSDAERDEVVLNTMTVGQVADLVQATRHTFGDRLCLMQQLVQRRFAQPLRWLNSESKCLRLLTLWQHIDTLYETAETTFFWQSDLLHLETQYAVPATSTTVVVAAVLD